MGIKDRIAQKALGGVTGKAMKGLQPFMESIHARLELQNLLSEERLKIDLMTKLKHTKEEADAYVKGIKNSI